MRVVRAGDYARMPWKNGGGETIEMLVSPEDASFDDFDWRISMARVATDGPFSTFAGVDRTLSVIAGHGIAFVFDDRSEALDRRSAPFRFAGDVPVDGILSDGAIDDLNVMTRRERCDHRVTRHALVAPMTLQWDGDVGIVVAIGAAVDGWIGDEAVTLAATDALVLDAHDVRQFALTPQAAADVFVIEIWTSA